MKFSLLLLGLILAVPLAAQQLAQVSGALVTPAQGGIVGGTLRLTLSGPALAAGSYYYVPATVACATSTGGAVVGAPDPTAIPAVEAEGSGTLPLGNYWVELAYTGALGAQTLASPALAVSLTGPGSLLVHAPVLQPAGATGYAVFIGTSGGGVQLQGTVSGWGNYTQSSPLGVGAAPQGANTTECLVARNDAVIPTGTYYTVTLADSQGATLAGFPQSWYLAGTNVNVATLTPLAAPPAVQYPTPILANPGTTQQSLNSNLNMGGNKIQEAGNVGPGTHAGFWSGALTGAGATLGSWTTYTGIEVQMVDMWAQSAGSGGTSGITVSVSDGTSTCNFAGLLPGTAQSTSQRLNTGYCIFPAADPLTVTIASDDHGSKPANVSWNIILTAY
ncbi:MAG: hypothetical protein ACRD01_09515 [Terriglobales bacterium]